ncbi:DUF6801 domain-containing protein [Knoellia sp. S7-12]|uniref:DUF6801 domain-containing protein n=1 Tax=Knoellia sp. S7-12 TaxID=3126698 RepID=UPI0033694C0E
MTSAALRRVCFTALAATAALTLAPSAQAASDDIAYTCTLFSLPTDIDLEDLSSDEREMLKSVEEGEVDAAEAAEDIPEFVEIEGLNATASFDSAIEDGATAAVGSRVELEPVAATLTFGDDVASELRTLGITDGIAGAGMLAGIEETEADRETEFFFEKLSVPASGGFTLTTEDGVADSIRINGAGTYTYVAGDLGVFFATGDDETGTFAALECVADDDQDLTIDQVTAKAAPPTGTPTPTPSGPVRPDVVQTDVAQPTSPSWLPFAAAGAGSFILVGGLTLTRRNAARH